MNKTKSVPSNGRSDKKNRCKDAHNDFSHRTCDFRLLNKMQLIFSWALRVHEKILIFSGIFRAFSFVFCIGMLTWETSLNQIKRESVVKLTVKLEKSTKAPNVCSCLVVCICYPINQLRPNSCFFYFIEGTKLMTGIKKFWVQNFAVFFQDFSFWPKFIKK